MTRFLIFLILIIACFELKSQDTYVPNEYILYFSDNASPSTVNSIAQTWQSNVLTNVQPGTNIAVLEFVGSFPFQNPYNPGEYLNSIIEVVGKVKKHEPLADGGSPNYYIIGATPGSDGSSCYDSNLLQGDVGPAPFVSVGVFDTGTNWIEANDVDFNFGTAQEIDGDAKDKNGHGTHVASIINGTYLSSVANSTSPIQYAFDNPLGASGTTTLAEMVLSMEGIINRGINVINCSFSYLAPELQFGFTQGSELEIVNHGEEDVLYLLMSSADPATTLFIVSAGNHNGLDLDGSSSLKAYPAAFPLENMITVASYDCFGNLSTFSNSGPISVDIAAPGEDIVSIDHEMDLVRYSGTSQAAAFVSGAAAIVGSHLPYFDAPKVKCAIMNTANYTPSLQGLLVTGGILNIPDAIDYVINGGCGSVLQASARNQQIFTTDFSLGPNPVISDLNISFELKKEGQVLITAYSLSGNKLSEQLEPGKAGRNDFSLNFDTFQPEQIVLLRVQTDEFVKTTKVFKAQ